MIRSLICRTAKPVATTVGQILLTVTVLLLLPDRPVNALDVPGALYVEATTNISGSSTDIIGGDDCGNDDKPGIVITLEEADDPIDQNGNPDITGTPDIVYAGGDLDVQTMVDGLKKFADFAYTVEGDTHTGNETPDPGDGWGTPIA